MHLYLLIDVSTWCPPQRRTRVACSGTCLKHYMDFVNRQGSFKNISRRSLVRTAVPDRQLDNIKHTLDVDMKIKWGVQVGPGWARYLGKEWRCRDDNGYFEVR
eukprot:1707644-Heterocapsa_arctica.AAC.1